MKRVYLALSALFAVLTFVGAGYVLINDGEPNAGYAVIPMLAALIFNMLYRVEKKKDADK